MEQKVAGELTEQEKGEGAEQSQNDAQLHGVLNRLADAAYVSLSGGLGDGRQQQNGEGAGDNGGEQDHGHCHAGEGPEYGERIFPSAAGGDECRGDENGLGAGKEV